MVLAIENILYENKCFAAENVQINIDGKKIMKSSKGSAFERKVCRKLSLWWSDGIDDDIFWRTASSGAMAKMRSKKGRRTFGQCGDIQANDPIGQPLLDKVAIELKNGYGHWSVMDVLDKTPKNILQWFEKFILQVEEDRVNAGVDYFLLITKRDQRVPLIFMPRPLYLKIFEVYGKPAFKYTPMMVSIALHDKLIVGMRLMDFLKWCRPDFFKTEKRRRREG